MFFSRKTNIFLHNSLQVTVYKDETTQQKGDKSCNPQRANNEIKSVIPDVWLTKMLTGQHRNVKVDWLW